MSTLSTFQTLPLHIAESIAHYCIHTHRLHHADIDYEKHGRQTWGDFYDVSNLWRALALRFYCKELHIVMHPSSSRKISFVDLPPLIKVHKHFYNYVRKLILVIGDLSLQSYSVIAKRYNELWPKDITLTSASQATIYLALNRVNSITVDNHVENERLFRLLQRIRISIPRLREVKMINSCKNDGYNPDHLANTTEPRLDSLFVDILKSASNLEVRTWPALIDGRDAQLMNGSLITSLSYTINKDMEFFLIVLQRIGPALESLKIEYFSPRSIKALLFNSDGSPIIYSQLKRLYFRAWTTTPRVDLTAPPFPNLRYLKWMSDYPFEDDVLFRGSLNTLEYLYVRFDSAALVALGRHDMSLRSRYTRLRHLSVEMSRYLVIENGFDRLLELSASLVSPETLTFATDGRCSYRQVLDTFSTWPCSENIRVLSLGATQLHLFQMLKLIKLLPNMTDLACSFGGRGADTHGKDDLTVVDRLYPEYYPLSQRLKCWEVTEILALTDVVTATITLAALCPGFTFVAVPPEDIDEYQAKLKVASESMEYRDHRDKIRYLISDEREQFIINNNL